MDQQQRSEDASLEEVFRQWNIPEEVIRAFTDNGLTIEILSKLTDDNYKELCPHLGTRIKLKEKITELLTATAPTESNINIESNISTNASEIVCLDNISFSDLVTANIIIPKTFPDFDLHTLLQTTPGGNSILQYYESNGCLNSNKRNQLTDIIVKHIYTNIVNRRVTYEDYNILAAKIITVFPKETVGTYFTHPIKKAESLDGRSTIARGKLVDKVRNLLHKYGDRKRPSSTTATDENEPPEKQIKFNNDVIWLKQNSEPWSEVLQKWRNTYDLRQSKYENVQEFLLDWPILGDSRSDSLINEDFDRMHNGKGQNFFLNWDKFCKTVVQHKPTNEESILSIQNKILNLSDDAKLPAQIDILARLIPPRGRLSRKVKFTTQEAIETIFVLAKSPGDVDAIIEKKRETARVNKIKVQPYIILQGSLLECSSPLLIIDDVRYQFRSITKAFDMLFKIYHVFHACYPRAGDYLYLIIQRCVYKIITKYDNVVAYISDILSVCSEI